MFKMRSLFLVCVGALIAALPVEVLAKVGDQPVSWDLVLTQITPLNWSLMIFGLINLVLFFTASRWVLIVTPVFLGVVVYLNLVPNRIEANFTPAHAFGLLCVMILLQILLLAKDARTALKENKSIKWLSPARQCVGVHATVCPVIGGGEIKSRTFDISEQGAFISCEEAGWEVANAVPLKNIKVGTHCSVKLRLDQLRTLHCSAQVIRKAASAGKYPSGFAVRFVGMSREEKLQLSTFLRKPELVA